VITLETKVITYIHSRINREQALEQDLLDELKELTAIPIPRTEWFEGNIWAKVSYRTDSTALDRIAKQNRIEHKLNRIKEYRKRWYIHLGTLPVNQRKTILRYLTFDICDDRTHLNGICANLLESLESERLRLHKESVENNKLKYINEVI
jgi:hypothetical protein